MSNNGSAKNQCTNATESQKPNAQPLEWSWSAELTNLTHSLTASSFDPMNEKTIWNDGHTDRGSSGVSPAGVEVSVQPRHRAGPAKQTVAGSGPLPLSRLPCCCEHVGTHHKVLHGGIVAIGKLLASVRLEISKWLCHVPSPTVTAQRPHLNASM